MDLMCDAAGPLKSKNLTQGWSQEGARGAHCQSGLKPGHTTQPMRLFFFPKHTHGVFVASRKMVSVMVTVTW